MGFVDVHFSGVCLLLREFHQSEPGIGTPLVFSHLVKNVKNIPEFLSFREGLTGLTGFTYSIDDGVAET